MGDGGDHDDPGGRAQKLGSLLGKMLRINPRDPDGRGPRHYSVPSDNPFVHRSGARHEIWALGLRNPWRWSFDRTTGDLLIGDVGQDAQEEVDFVAANSSGRNAGKGDNFGWDLCEGKLEHESSGKDCKTFGVTPIRVYGHGTGCAVTGGYVYRGPDYPAWRGKYVYADYCSGKLWVTSTSGHLVDSLSTGRNISGFGEDGAGRLFVTDLNGAILRVRFSGAP